MRILVLLALLSGCGSEEVLIAPTAKTLRVGESAQFVLDSDQSSGVLRSGKLVLSVVSIDDVETNVSAKAFLDTVFGKQNVEIAKPIENEILNEDFLVRFRNEKHYRAKRMTLDYAGLTGNGCDVIKVSEIEGQDGVTLEPTLCLAAQTIPTLVVKIGEIKATFRQSN